MAAFMITRLPFHPKSLEAVEFMQKNGFSYRISTNVPLMNHVMASGGGENHQLAAVMDFSEELEQGNEEVQVANEFASNFPSEVKVESDESQILQENSVPIEPTIKEVLNEDDKHSSREEADDHQEQEKEMNKPENDDGILADVDEDEKKVDEPLTFINEQARRVPQMRGELKVVTSGDMIVVVKASGEGIRFSPDPKHLGRYACTRRLKSKKGHKCSGNVFLVKPVTPEQVFSALKRLSSECMWQRAHE